LRSLLSRLTYANVMATLAFFLAVSGATALGASGLLTGRDIKNGSITGADIRNHSLSSSDLGKSAVTGAAVHDGSVTGADVKDGSLRAADFAAGDLELLRGPKGDTGAKGDQGPQGPAGPTGEPGAAGIEHVSWTGADVTSYVNDTPLVDQHVPANGGWLMLATMQVTNTSASDDSFNCGLYVDGQQVGGGGDSVSAGTTKELNSVAFGPADAGTEVVLKCENGGGGGTFDVSGISIRLAKLM
jgi:hypothetical protein